MLQKFLLVWLTLLSLLAYIWPQWFVGGFDPFVATKPAIPYLFAATMFAIGSLLPVDELRQVMRRWPKVVGGTLIQYTTMPIFAFTLGKLFGLEGEMLLGVILVGAVPGAMASNVLTLTAGGNVSYSVGLTTSATLLSPLLVPLVLYLTIQQKEIDKVALVIQAFWILITQVVGPVLSGVLISRRFPKFQAAMKSWGPVIANLTILWIIAVIVNANHKRLSTAPVNLMTILLIINLLGYSAGYMGSRLLKLPEQMSRALTLEIGLQNAGLGSSLATQLFKDRDIVALPPTLYMFGCMLTGTILAQIWSLRRVETDAEDLRSLEPASVVEEPEG